LQHSGHAIVLVSTVASEHAHHMRLRRTSRPALELASSEHATVAVWDGLTSAGPIAVIRAARAGELVVADAVKQVA
jgi:hypothetical protein